MRPSIAMPNEFTFCGLTITCSDKLLIPSTAYVVQKDEKKITSRRKKALHLLYRFVYGFDIHMRARD